MAHTVFHVNLLSAASSGSGTLGPARLAKARDVIFHIAWGSGVSAGSLAIETANDEAYTGTWKLLDTITFGASAPNQDAWQSSGPYAALRARIVSVTGGTVTVDAVGN